MNREFEFFITEERAGMNDIAAQKEKQGAQRVGNAAELFSYIVDHTLPKEDFSCRISGAWLDVCVARSVRGLLSPYGVRLYVPERTVSAVLVDLTTSVAFKKELSIEEKRFLFISKLGPLPYDPRLTILPRGGV
jgi:hypothetical protein